MTDVERDEEERRYDESATDKTRVFDSRVLAHSLDTLESKPAVQVSGTDSVADVVGRMQKEKNGCALVVDGERLAGIFTERDILLQVVCGGVDPQRTPVSDVMTPDPESLTSADSIGALLNKMAVSGFRHVPIVDTSGRPQTVISMREAMEYLADFFPEEALNLPPRSFVDRPPRNQHGG